MGATAKAQSPNAHVLFEEINHHFHIKCRSSTRKADAPRLSDRPLNYRRSAESLICANFPLLWVPGRQVYPNPRCHAALKSRNDAGLLSICFRELTATSLH